MKEQQIQKDRSKEIVQETGMVLVLLNKLLGHALDKPKWNRAEAFYQHMMTKGYVGNY